MACACPLPSIRPDGPSHLCVRRGRLRAMGGIAAALTPDQVARFDRELDALLREHAPDEPLFIPHRVWAMIATRPAK